MERLRELCFRSPTYIWSSYGSLRQKEQGTKTGDKIGEFLCRTFVREINQSHRSHLSGTKGLAVRSPP
ncbi:hypothetical protein X777_08172 [Ooceraea biroi]|uniref:Uncharacterized protein n=1 Tax=Ooceraea biroi TaxID=2015173 RepID=A0A026WY07_OOCBI|nr:hypothetical protein X777_08172 [Ooceraea biroi]